MLILLLSDSVRIEPWFICKPCVCQYVLFIQWHLISFNLPLPLTSVNLNRILAFNAFFNKVSLRLFLNRLVEFSSIFESDCKKISCFSPYNLLSLLIWWESSTDFFLLHRSDNIPWTSNLFIMFLRIKIGDKFLLWNPDKNRNDLITEGIDLDKIHFLIACFFALKLALLHKVNVQDMRRADWLGVNVHTFATWWRYQLS